RDGRQIEKARPRGYQDPIGIGFLVHLGAIIGEQHGWLAVLGGGERNDRGERKIPVRDMDGENAVRLEMPPVEGESFASEKMHRDGVAREGVESEKVESLGRLALEREPGVAWNNGVRTRANAQKSKLGGGDAYDVRIDFI